MQIRLSSHVTQQNCTTKGHADCIQQTNAMYIMAWITCAVMYLIGATGFFFLACFSFVVKLSHLKCRLQSNPEKKSHKWTTELINLEGMAPNCKYTTSM